MLTKDDFLAEAEAAFRTRKLVRATFSEIASKEKDLPKRQKVRPITLKQRPLYQWTLQQTRGETHDNLDVEESARRFRHLVTNQYRQALITTAECELHYRLDRAGRVHVSRREIAREIGATSHDRQKSHLIPEGVPCPFLIEQGVMREDGKVIAGMAHKFRQVNRFLEFVEDIYPALPGEGILNVVDYGCGKSYLTFAIHHLLTVVHEREVAIAGLDRNENVVETCRRTSEKLGLEGLTFQTAQIRDREEEEAPLHLAVALHACDTATDEALADAVRRKAAVILAAPCCQHEVAQAMKPEGLPLLGAHGILRERFASLATDGLRAAALESSGYKTQVLEFVDTEHTPKNLLLRAVRRTPKEKILPRWQQQYESLKATLGLETISSDGILSAHPG